MLKIIQQSVKTGWVVYFMCMSTGAQNFEVISHNAFRTGIDMKASFIKPPKPVVLTLSSTRDGSNLKDNVFIFKM